MFDPRCTLLGLVFCMLPLRSGADVLITEFMADNETSLADEDGEFEDWIELHNAGTTAVNLGGWFLTDDAADLDQWPIPSVVLEAGDFLVIFASGKDRRVPGAELHTNFKLSAGGEYLALVRADAVTVEQEFAPEFPAQDEDRSFGLAFDGIPLVAEGASANYLVPSDGSLGSSWTQPGFVPGAGWSNGETGIGFGLMIPGMTVRDVKSTVVINSIGVADAVLAGTNVASEVSEVHPVANFYDTGGDGHYGNNAVFPGGGGDDFVVEVTGTIIIPTNGIWTFGINSDDGGRISIDGNVVMDDPTYHGPQDHLGSVYLTAGAHSLTAMFFERGGGAEMELFAAPGSFSAFDAVAFDLVGDTASGGLEVFTMPDGTAGGGLIATDIGPQMQGQNPGVYVRVPFAVNDVSALESVSLAMRYNDGFVAYLNGTRVASRNASAGTPAWSAAATGGRADAEAFVPENFNLTAHVGLLNAGGNNVLAIHGLNVNASDDSFLVLPELTGGGLLAGDPFYFDDVTPGGINSPPSSQGKVADTKFQPNRGFYDVPVQVAITTETVGATIRYTTDGSKPTATHGGVYTGPVTISRTTPLRAAAFKTGFDPTDVDSHTYIFLDDVITQSTSAPPGWPTGPVNGQVFRYGMGQAVVNNGNPAIGGVQRTKDALTALPTLSITTDQANLTDPAKGIYVNAGNRGYAWERESAIELIFPPGYVDPDGNTEGFESPCGLRIRGGFSRQGGNPKHSWRVFFRGEYGNGRLNYRLFGDEGADEFDKFDLRGPQNYSWAMGGTGQNSFVRDTWSRDLQGEMGHPHERGRWHHLYLNGIYWGLVQTCERPEANYAESYFGGDQLDYDVVKSFGDVTDGNRESYSRLHQKWQAGFASNSAYFDVLGKNAAGVDDPAKEKLIDLENLADYMIITYYTGDRDGPGSRFTQPRPNNYFGIFNRNNPDGFKFFEHDSEHSLGRGDNNMVTPYTSSSTLEEFNPHTLHEKLAGDNLEYRMAFADRVAKYCYNNGLLTDAIGIDRVDRRVARLDPAIIAHSARWGDTTRSRVDWLGAVQGVRDFINGRVPTTISQLRTVGWYPSMDPPVFSRHGGHVGSDEEIRISGGPGTIYYTVDGRDPRQLGGAVTGGASVFVGNTSGETLVASGASWRYRDNGSNQGTAWRQAGFDDSGWALGAAQLGYGDGDETTTVSFGTNENAKHRTTYFRHSFSASEVDEFSSLQLEVMRDDGAVVYLNGQEVARSNMPAGTINYLTPADGVVGGGDESAFYAFAVPTGLLVEGSNTLAVEIHQISAISSDISFDLKLTGVRTTSANPPLLAGPGVQTLKARVLDAGEWSALTEAEFVVDTDPADATNLMITEIHYRPAAPSAAELAAGFNERSHFEFVELQNIGPRSIDLAGLVVSQGVGFEFEVSSPWRILAPGERILLVNNLAAFEMRFGTGLPVAGEFSGNLSNDGEGLTVGIPESAPIIDFVFNDADPWPASADGDGYSLVLMDPEAQLDPNDPASWRSSAAIGGTPGTTDAASYPAWKLANGITDDDGDPDGDGLTHFVEYAIGGDPFVADQPAALGIEFRPVEVGGVVNDYLVFRISRRVGADDVIIAPEASIDLSAWVSGVFELSSVVNDGAGLEVLEFRSTFTISPAIDRVFARGAFALRP